MRGHILSIACAAAGLAGLSACGVGLGEASESETRAAATPEATIETTGTVIEIEMLTRDPDDPAGHQVFRPRLVRARVGDTIRFIPTDSSHNSTSIPGMVPEGVEGWDGPLNTEISYVIPEPGVYGFKCLPHYAAGMVGLIVVDGGSNLADAKAANHPGRAGGEFAKIFEEAGL